MEIKQLTIGHYWNGCLKMVTRWKKIVFCANYDGKWKKIIFIS